MYSKYYKDKLRWIPDCWTFTLIFIQPFCFPEKVTAQDVVEGHREKTLKLLWAIILHYQVSVLINMDQLREEINVLEKSLRVKTKLQELNRLLSGTLFINYVFQSKVHMIIYIS